MNEVASELKEYRPSKQQCLREYELRIRFLSIGCVVEVGCQSIPFENVEVALKEINNYFNKPYETQQKWRAIFDQN